MENRKSSRQNEKIAFSELFSKSLFPNNIQKCFLKIHRMIRYSILLVPVFINRTKFRTLLEIPSVPECRSRYEIRAVCRAMRDSCSRFFTFNALAINYNHSFYKVMRFHENTIVSYYTSICFQKNV